MEPLSETTEPSDRSLLIRYRDRGDESAFALLVRRHLGMVFSAARRVLQGDVHHAEEITQLVFTELSRKVAQLIDHPMLAGWLYTVTCRMAADRRRSLRRRQARERLMPQLPELPALPEPDWSQLGPVLDEVMLELPEPDRNAVLLRFFEQSDFRTIGRTFSVSEDAARMRVNRALGRLRERLAHRGIACAEAALSAVLIARAVDVPAAQLESAVLRSGVAFRPQAPPTRPISLSWGRRLLMVSAGTGLIVLVTSRLIPSGSTTRATALLDPNENAAAAIPSASNPASGVSNFTVRPAGPRTADALAKLHSALFDTWLEAPERYRRLKESAGDLVGQEEAAVATFQSALRSGDPRVIGLAVNGAGFFGPMLAALHEDLLRVLSETDHPELAGLIANRLSFGPSSSAEIDELIRWIVTKPVLRETLAWLVPEAMAGDPARLESRRQHLMALTEDPDPSIRDTATKVLSAVREPPVSSPASLTATVAAKLHSSEPAILQSALLEVRQLPVVTPDVKSEITGLAAAHPLPEVRLAARQALRSLDSGADDSGCCPNGGISVPSEPGDPQAVTRDIAALAGDVNSAAAAAERLAGVDRRYWNAHPAEKISVTRMLDLLVRDPNPVVVRAAAEGLSRLRDASPKPVFTVEELQPLFDTMASTLSPGEYRIARRDLQSSVEQYWGMVGTLQAAESLIPAHLVEVLPVGPLHENPTAFQAMVRTLRQIDPRLRMPSKAP